MFSYFYTVLNPSYQRIVVLSNVNFSKFIYTIFYIKKFTMKLFTKYIYPRLMLDMITFYPPLMVIGWYAAGKIFDLNILVGVIANYLFLVIAFVYNDIKDREDDAGLKYQRLSFTEHVKSNLGLFKTNVGYKRFVNPFSNSDNQNRILTGYSFLIFIGILSILLSFFAGGIWTSLQAASMILVGVLYSGGGLRLKSVPIVDLISHSYILAGGQVLYFLTFESANLGLFSLLTFFGVTIYSIGGDLENEYRDFVEDRNAGITNTSSIMGEQLTYRSSQIIRSIGILLVLIAIVIRLFTIQF